MAFNWLGFSGCASGSDLAAAVISLSSATVGSVMMGRLDTLDIVLDLASICPAQTDDPSDVGPIDKGNAVERAGRRRQGDHAVLAIRFSLIDPDQRVIPIEFSSKFQRQAMLVSVRTVFLCVELNSHSLL
jgi:hypothetical protein